MFIIALRMATIMLFLPPQTLEATLLFFLRADERENQNRSGDILVLREEWQLVHTNATTTAHSATYIYEYQPHLPQGIWGTHRYVPFGYSTKGEGAGVPLRLASFKLGSGAKNIDLLRTRAHHKYRRAAHGSNARSKLSAPVGRTAPPMMGLSSSVGAAAGQSHYRRNVYG